MPAVKGSSPQGPFVTGFVAGMAAGAAAVYFFATDRGKDFVSEMEELWEEARPELAKRGVIKNADESLAEAIKGLLIQAFADKAQQLTVSKKRIRSTKTLFKGV
jgi:hypothetical protein